VEVGFNSFQFAALRSGLLEQGCSGTPCGPRTAHEFSRGRRGSLETVQPSTGTVRLAPQYWQTQTFRLGVSRASVIEVEQTGQISVPSVGLWDTGSPIGSPHNEMVKPISKNRVPRHLSFCLRDGFCPNAQPNPLVCGLDVATFIREDNMAKRKAATRQGGSKKRAAKRELINTGSDKRFVR
jgi:hypothetical protein